jgi:signal transduction histidine kinase
LAGVAWISATTLRLERSEAAAARRAWLEERVRLALWRMDGAATPLVAGESARAEGSPFVRVRFRVDPDGTVALSPGYVGDAPPIAQLRIRDALPGSQAPDVVALRPGLEVRDEQQDRNDREWRARAKSVRQAATLYRAENDAKGASDDNWAVAAPPRLVPGMTAVWIGRELLLVRRTSGPAGETLEGSWLDWPALRASLVGEVVDLLPGASLEPAPAAMGGATGAAGADRLLASLPVRLVPGAMPGDLAGGFPVRRILALAWTGVLVAVLAILALVIGAVSLSERRATFVSAVTHELRTPLTTLRTYSEMLASGMVEGEEKRKSYLDTLAREAERLGHLVENVLSFSRLERVGGGEIRLADRAAQAGMTLELDLPQALGARATPAAVEQILFNLFDNACKYAGAAEDRRIHVTAERDRRGRILVRVADHGPGIPQEARRKLFRAFGRSARDAAGRAPGVGLGLALARRLARSMGGDLVLEDRDGGASFALILRSRSV